MKPTLRDRTDRNWFSRLLRHLARNGAGLFLQPWSLHRASMLDTELRNANMQYYLTTQQKNKHIKSHFTHSLDHSSFQLFVIFWCTDTVFYFQHQSTRAYSSGLNCSNLYRPTIYWQSPQSHTGYHSKQFHNYVQLFIFSLNRFIIAAKKNIKMYLAKPTASHLSYIL